MSVCLLHIQIQTPAVLECVRDTFPAVMLDKNTDLWLGAFCLLQHPASSVLVSICQQIRPITLCHLGKSAPCHLRNDNLLPSQTPEPIMRLDSTVFSLRPIVKKKNGKENKYIVINYQTQRPVQ